MTKSVEYQVVVNFMDQSQQTFTIPANFLQKFLSAMQRNETFFSEDDKNFPSTGIWLDKEKIKSCHVLKLPGEKNESGAQTSNDANSSKPARTNKPSKKTS